jgi:vancomycin resistance protein YoaR
VGTSADGTIRSSGHGRRNAAVVCGAVAVVLAGGYLVGHFMTADSLPANTTIQGVRVGGLHSDDARAKVSAALGEELAAPMYLADGATTVPLSPASAGLTVDWEATMAKVDPGNSWNPRVIWNTLRGGNSVALVSKVDEKALTSAVKAAAPKFAVTPKDATVALKGTRVLTTKAVQGRTLQIDPTVEKVQQYWPLKQRGNVPASVTRKAPAVTDAEVSQLVSRTLEPTLSAPVTVDTGTTKFSVTVPQIASATTVTSARGAVSAKTDMARLYKATETTRDRLGLETGRDARIVITGNSPTIQPSTDGRGISQANFTKAVEPALTKKGTARIGKAPITAVPAKFTTADAQKMGVKQVIGEFTTYFPYAEYRNTNLTIAANTINGTFLKPGQTFSMDKVLGPRTEAKGYVPGWVISGSVMKEEPAGGISQSGTTTFNAAFFAGMTDVEHHPHTMYFDRYPAGREATLYYGNLDLKFRNDTKYGVLVQAYTKKAQPDGRGSITVKMWSTPTWDKVTSSPLTKSNYEYGRTITSTDADCHPQSPSPGFDVNYSRMFWKNGAVARTEKFFWRYDPTDEVNCK